MLREEARDGRASVTTSEERVLLLLLVAVPVHIVGHRDNVLRSYSMFSLVS